MGYSSIIFDLDGTLLDTLGDIAATANEVLELQGLPIHPVDNFRNFVGSGLGVLLERIIPVGSDEATMRKCYQMFLRLYERNWNNSCRPYPGILDMLTELKERGIGLAVLSNKPHPFTERFVERYFPEETFRYVYGQRPGFAKKPDPGVALEIATRMKENPRNMVFVGDTPIDIHTGKAAGMSTVAVSWGFRSYNELKVESPDLIINRPVELINYVLPSS